VRRRAAGSWLNFAVAEIHHFTYGGLTPAVSFLMAFVGSWLGLVFTARARRSRTRGRSTRWLVIAAVSIGGAAIWLMHFMAMLGFDVPDSPVRYDPTLTFASLVLAVVGVYIGLFIVARGRRSAARLLAGGAVLGLGIAAMHYAGLWALRLAGQVRFDPGLVGASVLIAVVAATTALWLTMRLPGWRPRLLAATTLGLAVCGTHYTAMAALRVELDPTPSAVDGIGPFLLIVPIILLTAVTLIATAISGLQAMTEEEFDGGRARRGGAHAEVPWSLRDGVAASANLSAPVPVLTPTAILPPVDRAA